MRKDGLQVDRPVVPISLQLSEDPKELADPHAYPIKVRSISDQIFVCIIPEGNSLRTLLGRAEALRQGIRRRHGNCTC